ncbi:MAG: class I SAM-dependent methyltransferase [Pseudomonadota bacterium]|uniref:Methyltransferase domain-containing protein n=1 Tax=Candidatus Desulfatibia profunda TaxID=2841695 RepID=A0A8J6NM97_9BACT|nr:methyltransferase domain-containing protein [Candidatus Desulfatibia profunda]MBL7178645.1 methyltransferase domain-containing protein [Desulfobacterales bacterium]
MGYVFDFNDAKACEEWYELPDNRFAADLESRLMIDMLQPKKRETVLDIGCGTGVSLLPFLEIGLQATGIDPSPYMLAIAKKNLGNRADLHRGFAEDLPFDDNSFNHACLVTTLEFVEAPQKALEEACRVAKDKLFLGFLNRYAIKGIQRRVKGLFVETIYNHAHFFSIWELKKNIRSILGDPPISWRTVCQLPSVSGEFAYRIERSHLAQRCPFGAFAGMVVTLVPRFRTRPLPIPCRAKPSTGAMVG